MRTHPTRREQILTSGQFGTLFRTLSIAISKWNFHLRIQYSLKYIVSEFGGIKMIHWIFIEFKSNLMRPAVCVFRNPKLTGNENVWPSEPSAISMYNIRNGMQMSWCGLNADSASCFGHFLEVEICNTKPRESSRFRHFSFGSPVTLTSSLHSLANYQNTKSFSLNFVRIPIFKKWISFVSVFIWFPEFWKETTGLDLESRLNELTDFIRKNNNFFFRARDLIFDQWNVCVSHQRRQVFPRGSHPADKWVKAVWATSCHHLSRLHAKN